MCIRHNNKRVYQTRFCIVSSFPNLKSECRDGPMSRRGPLHRLVRHLCRKNPRPLSLPYVGADKPVRQVQLTTRKNDGVDRTLLSYRAMCNTPLKKQP